MYCKSTTFFIILSIQEFHANSLLWCGFLRKLTCVKASIVDGGSIVLSEKDVLPVKQSERSCHPPTHLEKNPWCCANSLINETCLGNNPEHPTNGLTLMIFMRGFHLRVVVFSNWCESCHLLIHRFHLHQPKKNTIRHHWSKGNYLRLIHHFPMMILSYNYALTTPADHVRSNNQETV